MKKFWIWILALGFVQCSSNNDIEVAPISINFVFTHSWQDTEVTSEDFNNFIFTNENGETLSIERLRYVVSDVQLLHESGVTTSLLEHKLIDVTNNDLTYTTAASILPGNYTAVSIRFGLTAAYNQDDAYADLNTANFNVGDALGGGYHYMQFDGEFQDTNNNELPFNYHVIAAVDTSVSPVVPEDTSLRLSLGSVTVSEDTTITINMDLYEWFSNPNLWDLNVLSTNLMGNYAAQIQMNQNSASVFSLVSITP